LVAVGTYAAWASSQRKKQEERYDEGFEARNEPYEYGATGSHGPLKESGWWWLERGEQVNPAWASGGGSGTTIIFNGDVYGLDDFQKKVLEATTEAYRGARNRL
jgi:environmental stress-induced protein Ves